MDPVIAIGSVVAVALMVLLNWLIGGWQTLRLDDPQMAVKRFLEDYWDADIAETRLSDDGKAALLELRDDDRIGLVVAMGDKLVTRQLGQSDVRRVEMRKKGEAYELSVQLQEFSFAPLLLTFSREAEARRWKTLMDHAPKTATEEATA